MSITKPLILALALALSAAPALAREHIQVAGSSTVLPYASIVAEAFADNTDFRTPVVEISHPQSISVAASSSASSAGTSAAQVSDKLTRAARAVPWCWHT